MQAFFHPRLRRAVKLGRKPVRSDPRTLKLAKYLPAVAPPAAVQWGSMISAWRMMLNDTEGDCTCAAAGHMEMLWTADESGLSNMFTPSDSSVQRMYEAVSGYQPGNPDTDNGADALTVLNYWRTIGLANHKIQLFGSVNPSQLANVLLTVYAFGGAYIGLNMPITSEDQTVWSVPGSLRGYGEPGSLGGHAVPIIGYKTLANGKRLFSVVSWGEVFQMTEYFFHCYCDEAYGIIAPEFFETGKGQNPVGINLAQALADLKQVTTA